MQLDNTKQFKAVDLMNLFKSVGWETDTNPVILQSAMLHSSRVVSIWDNSKLIGLIRCFDDGCWSAVIDCLVVHREYQRQGIATKLIYELLKQIKNIATVYVAPDERTKFNLYKHVGFEEKASGGLLVLNWKSFEEQCIVK